MRTGSIYKIKCLLDNRVYIGQTIMPPPKRWMEHFRQMNNESNQLYLYRAMRKHGIENFTFQVIETDIPQEQLDDREIFYINEYQSNNKYGYNLTAGGYNSHASKITEKIAKEIALTLRDNDCKTTEIARIYNISREMISDINNGDTWYFSDLSYPLRVSRYHNHLSQSEVQEIIQMLQSQEYSATEIAECYNVSITEISAINHGKKYKILDDDQYPLYVAYNSKNNLSVTEVKQVIEALLLHKELDYNQLEKQLKFTRRKTISGINRGTLYKEHIAFLGYNNFPIREHYDKPINDSS